jgi:hypothetical protein
MEATVPICISVVVQRMLPTLSSVRKAVPVPVTVVLPSGTLIVPERCVLGQAVASQVPDATLVISRLAAFARKAGSAANSIITIVKRATALFISIFVPIFVPIILLGFNHTLEGLPSAAMHSI